VNVIPGVDLTATAKAGVWLFFLLSAHLLVGKMVRQLDSGLDPMRVIAAYAVRRVLRIMPLYLLLLSFLGSIHYQNHFDWRTVARHAALIEGWQHFWTIPVEMKFYLLVPILALGLAAAPVRARLVAALALLFVSALAYLQAPYPRIAGNPLPLQGYLVFFLLGIVTKLAAARVALHRPAAWAAVCVLVAIISHPRVITEVAGVPIEHSLELYPIFALAMATAMLAGGQSDKIRAWLNGRVLVGVGKISFALYLTHYFVLPLVVQVEILGALRGVAAVAASIMVAWACYRLIEVPFLCWGGTIADRILFGMSAAASNSEILRR
jgi:peptidoglycan/LPS O-acetylase OafA/YrhL